MATDQSEDSKSKDTSDSTAKPDPATLNTTDPQEHMEGPVSSLMKKTGDDFDNDETADGKKKPATDE